MKKKSAAILIIFMLSLTGCGANSLEQSNSNEPSVVQDYDITVPLIEGDSVSEIAGKYTGEMVAGKPQGKGTLIIEGENNTQYIYEGSFVDGAFDGYGITSLTTDGETYEMAGTYSKGEFTPSTGEFLDCMGQLDLFGPYKLAESVIDFIDDNSDLFPNATKKALENAKIVDFSYKHFKKTREQEKIGLVRLDLSAVQVFEDDFFSKKLTYLLGVDNEENYYAVYYQGSAEVYDGDEITVYAIPCDTTSFSNVSGGSTNVVVMAACAIN